MEKLYDNELVKIDVNYVGDSWQQFNINKGKELIGLVFAGTDGIEHESCNIYITWTFFNEYDEDDLIYFIQENEYSVAEALEDKCISVWDYYSKITMKGKQIILEDLGDFF